MFDIVLTVNIFLFCFRCQLYSFNGFYWFICIITFNFNNNFTNNDVKRAGYNVLEKKGATYYAIALAIKRIVEAILNNENSILTVSSLLKGEYGIQDVYMGVPTILGREGAKKILQVNLSEDENNQLLESSKVLKPIIKDSKI